MKSEHVITISKNSCIRCGLCVKDCPMNNIKLEASGATIIAQNCIKCGHCSAICPKNAVSLSGFADPAENIASADILNASELLAAIKARRSVRQFTDQTIEPAVIAQILEAGRYTPSGSNKQDVSYAVLQENIAAYEKTALKIFRRAKKFFSIFVSSYRGIAIDDDFLFKKAPLVIVIKSSSTVDGALAASNLELMAQAHNLGVLYSGFFTEICRFSPRLKKKLAVRVREKGVATLVIGHPAVRYWRTAQKERLDIVCD